MNKKIIASILGGVGLLGVAFQASAASSFTVNPDSINGSLPGTNVTFDATNISGISSGLINLDFTTQTASESGWLNLTAFNNGANEVFASVSGLSGVSYQLFIDFDLTAAYSAALSTGGAIFGQNGSGYVITSLTFTLYADPTLNTVFTSADSAGAGTEASFTPAPPSDLITLATGTLTGGQAFINAGGVALNALTTFDLTSPAGTNYFVGPVPFYKLAFDAFNNTGGSVVADYNTAAGCLAAGCQIAVKSGVGTVDFVPEPATVALLGMGLLGFGASRRRSA